MPAQLTHRPFTFFNPSKHSAPPTSPSSSPATADGRSGLSASKRRLINIQAGLAELMLLNRLRARTRRDLAGDTLERAAQIIEVTSRHWFAESAALAESTSAPGDASLPNRQESKLRVMPDTQDRQEAASEPELLSR